MEDVKKVLITIETIYAVVLFIKEGMARQNATEPGEQAQHEKKMKSIVILAIIIVSASALIPTILAYYK